MACDAKQSFSARPIPDLEKPALVILLQSLSLQQVTCIIRLLAELKVSDEAVCFNAAAVEQLSDGIP